MSVSHPLPRTFEEAMEIVKKILGASEFLAHRYRDGGGFESEAEQIVIGAFRKATGRGRTFSRNDLYVRVLEVFPREAGETAIAYAKARALGEPLQYLLGYQYFLNHEYLVDRHVLIPRPETEILAFEAIQFLKRSGREIRTGIEVGLGSGILSIELLKCMSGLRMTASELSPGARAVAEENAKRILGGPERLTVLAVASPDRVLEPFVEPADFIISNPPYLNGPEEADADVLMHEPAGALFAPKGQPLYFYERIARDAARLLHPQGVVFLELPHERAEEIEKLFSSGFRTALIPDLHGRNRVLRAESKSNG